MEHRNGEEGLIPEMEVRERIHIMPLGFEDERAYLTAEKLKADRVILVAQPDSNKYVNKSENELTNRGIEVEVERTNIFDLYSSIGTIAELIHDHQEDKVYVNIATGGKILAIAGMIACMVTGAEPYYVRAKNYDTNVPKGVASIKSLPRYPIEAPEAQQIHILDYIQEREDENDFPTKGELIEYGEIVGLPFIAEHKVDDKGKYRLLDSHIIEPLEDAGYIVIEKAGREKKIALTQNGKGTLRAFRYMINDGNEGTNKDNEKRGKTKMEGTL